MNIKLWCPPCTSFHTDLSGAFPTYYYLVAIVWIYALAPIQDGISFDVLGQSTNQLKIRCLYDRWLAECMAACINFTKSMTVYQFYAAAAFPNSLIPVCLSVFLQRILRLSVCRFLLLYIRLLKQVRTYFTFHYGMTSVFHHHFFYMSTVF